MELMGELIHGDFAEVAYLLPGIDLAFLDPPFNAGKVYGSGQYNDRQTPERYRAWLERQLSSLVPLLNPGATLWLMNDTRWIGHCQVLLDGLGLTFLNMVAWLYTNPTPAKKRYPKSWRPILVYCNGKEPRVWDSAALPMERPTLYFNPERRERGRPFVHDVWADVPKLVGGFLAQPELQRKDNGQFAHITQMPLMLAERAILTATGPGDMVLDPFAGSGTVLAAAQKHGRRWIGVEQEEEYVALIRRRLGLVAKAEATFR